MNMKQQDNKTYIVYKHTSPNNKIYIGISKNDPKYRWLNNGNTHEYKEGEIYDVTEEDIKILKQLGYEFEIV